MAKEHDWIFCRGGRDSCSSALKAVVGQVVQTGKLLNKKRVHLNDINLYLSQNGLAVVEGADNKEYISLLEEAKKEGFLSEFRGFYCATQKGLSALCGDLFSNDTFITSMGGRANLNRYSDTKIAVGALDPESTRGYR